jgi:hypothetical protein
MGQPDAVNKMVQRMRAAGLPLDGGIQLSVTRHFSNPTGFEFRCNKVDRLLTMAVNSRKLGPNTVGLPDADPWRDARIDSIGYSEIGVYDYLHIDFSTTREGLCRVYVAPHSWGRWSNALSGPPAYLKEDVYIAVAKRAAVFGIKLDKFIEGNVTVGGTTLDGVTFSPADYEGLVKAVELAKRNGNFIEGKKVGPKDAIDLSFMATSGTGLREISWTNGEQATLDFSALHLALSPLSCNIHIDEFGVVIATADGKIMLSPNALHHIANELILKTIIKEFLRDKIGLPPAIIDHLFVELMNASNKFNQVGGGVEFHPWKSVKITAGYACNVFDGDGCRKNFTFTKSF